MIDDAIDNLIDDLIDGLIEDMIDDMFFKSILINWDMKLFAIFNLKTLASV